MSAERSPDFDADVRPVLQKHCFSCHGPEKQKGKIRLDNLSTNLIEDVRAAETWHEVRNAINLGEMPPDDEEPLSPGERQQLLGWLNWEIEAAAEAQRSTGGRVVVRRLNRTEYQNTMRDLFGLDVDYVRDFPPEGMSEDGFRNNGASLQLSAIQLEYYLAAARKALDRVIRTDAEPEVFEHRFEKADTRRWPQNLQGANRLGRGRVFRQTMKKDYPEEGEFVVRVKAKADFPEKPGPVPVMRVEVGYRPDTVMDLETLAEIDVTKEGWQEYEFRGRVENFPLPVRGQGKFPGLVVSVQNAYDEFGKPKMKEIKDEKGKKKKVFEDDPEYPYLEIESVEFNGPILEAWPPAEHRRILFDSELRETDESAYAKAVLERFLPRAWRRPVTEEDLAPMVEFFDAVRAEMPDFEEAMRETLALALISPDFLYLLEPADESKRPLTEFELASRLSYFLWSTMPDEELMEAARTRQLLETETLRAQVERMLKDERSWQFVEQFASQWLDLSAMDRQEVDKKMFPSFRDELREDMREETLQFFAEVLETNRSAREFVRADFAMLNGDLARHYRLDEVFGGEFRPVNLKESDRPGGLLTQASILLGHSTGSDSHIIKRAVFIRDRLLDDPPAPPPPNVPDLETADPEFAKLPIREQLAIHREDPACADCHAGIDSWGIALEEFGPLGLRRTEIVRQVGKSKIKLPVDSRAELPGGVEVNGIDELADYLLEHREEQFARALASKVLTYAVGRTLEFSDEVEVDALTSEFVKNDLRLRDLIHSIVASESFRTK